MRNILSTFPFFLLDNAVTFSRERLMLVSRTSSRKSSFPMWYDGMAHICQRIEWQCEKVDMCTRAEEKSDVWNFSNLHDCRTFQSLQGPPLAASPGLACFWFLLLSLAEMLEIWNPTRMATLLSVFQYYNSLNWNVLSSFCLTNASRQVP